LERKSNPFTNKSKPNSGILLKKYGRFSQMWQLSYKEIIFDFGILTIDFQ